jgi:hypothetical protein
MQNQDLLLSKPSRFDITDQQQHENGKEKTQNLSTRYLNSNTVQAS